MEAVEPLQHLSDTIEMNRQLHVCVQKKEEEISALKQKNTQLMELVTQAQIYAALLDACTPQLEDTSECVSHTASASCVTPHYCSLSPEPSDWHFSAELQPAWLESLLSHTPPEEEEEGTCTILSEHKNTGVKRRLWPSDANPDSTDTPSGKQPRLEHHSPENLGLETVKVFGSFCGLQVLKHTPSATSDLFRKERRAFFKMSIGEHSSVRTKVFPNGKTFTSHTPDGGCKFLWIPKQN